MDEVERGHYAEQGTSWQVGQIGNGMADVLACPFAGQLPTQIGAKELLHQLFGRHLLALRCLLQQLPLALVHLNS